MQKHRSIRKALFGSVLGGAMLGAIQLVSADTIYLPITRDGSWPVKCAKETLGTCHNRWHPDIKPAATANPGDTVIFETRDALDTPFNWESGPKVVAGINLNLVHPLTGPVYVNGADRGDVLAVTMLDVIPAPDRFGYTTVVPGFGFLRDLFPNAAIVHWQLLQRPTGVYYAISDDLPGVELPLHGFAGTIGVALGMPDIETVYAREEARIRSALGERALLVEHVGSTSVPGLAAKPRIDIHSNDYRVWKAIRVATRRATVA